MLTAPRWPTVCFQYYLGTLAILAGLTKAAMRSQAVREAIAALADDLKWIVTWLGANSCMYRLGAQVVSRKPNRELCSGVRPPFVSFAAGGEPRRELLVRRLQAVAPDLGLTLTRTQQPLDREVFYDSDDGAYWGV